MTADGKASGPVPVPESTGSSPLGPGRAVFLVLALLAVAAVAAYRNTLTAPFVLDDGGSITENATIHRLWPPWTALSPPAGGTTVTGRPVLNFSLAVNYAISGEAVWSYHLLNLVIHLLAAGTLFGLVRRTLARPLLRCRFGRAQIPLAASIAAVWLLHPLQTEAVTYVSQRSESLLGLFFLLTFYGFVRSVEGRSSRFWRGAAVVACLLGMATKEVMVTVPVLLVLYDRTFVAGSFRRVWDERRGFHLATAMTCLLVVGLVAGTGWNRGGTAGFNVGISPWAYWLTQCEALVHYLRLSLWPHPLVFEYGTFWLTLGDALPYLLLVLPLLAVVVVALWRWPAAGFLGAWFFVILAPTTIVPGTIQMIVEHRMYLPLAALVTLAVTGLFTVLGRRSLVLWPVLGLGLGWLSFVRNEAYESDLGLWLDTVTKVPGNARARYNLGIMYSERGQYVHAVEQGEAALSVPDGRFYAAKAQLYHNKLGHDLAMLGRTADAMAHYEQALRIDPDYAIAHLNLARALVSLGRYPEAITHFEFALQRHFGGAVAESELSDALMRAGRPGEAISHLRSVLREMPRWTPGWNNLGYALLLDGDVDESIAAYRNAVRLDPRYAAAWVGLGYALITAGRPAEAVAPCTEAVKLTPRFADAHNTLGIAYAQMGRNAEAIACFERTLRLDDSGADVHNNLGNVLAAVGRRGEAIAQYREALRRNPDYAPAHRNLAVELRRAGRSTEAAEHFAAAARLEAAAGARSPGSHP